YRLSKNSKNLESAVAVYKNAVARLKPERDPDIWAVAQGNLTTAMKARGTVEKNDDALKEAAIAYQKMAETLGRDTHPSTGRWRTSATVSCSIGFPCAPAAPPSCRRPARPSRRRSRSIPRKPCRRAGPK
ncbi:MAG: hypothetical protein VW338_18510, partial [Rhodospirillaceae bacterium]